MLRGLVFKIAFPIVVLAVAAGAGWWFFIREDNEAQKEAADVTDEVRQSASATATSGSTPAIGGAETVDAEIPPGSSSYKGRAYRILEDQSSAWYLAPEKLASLPTSSTAQGTTKDVRGEFHVVEGGLDSEKVTTFTIGLDSLTSDENRRDNRVRDALQISRYPEAVFTAESLSGLPAELPTTRETQVTMELSGTLDLHGVQKDVTFTLQAFESDGIISVLGTTKFRYDDFNIRKPEIAGFVTVEDEVTLQIQLYAAPA